MNSFDLFRTLTQARSGNAGEDTVENHYAIAENVAKVGSDDIVVSEYERSREDKARAILDRIGLPHIKLIVTENGKTSGSIWSELRRNGSEVTEHLGDNLLCDVENPRRHGIKTTQVFQHAYTSAEKEFADAGMPTLANVMREARLTTWEPAYRQLQLLQTQTNFPLLFVASILLHRTNPIKVLMSSRDCCLWQHAQTLVRNLHGADYPIDYFKTSRIARAFPTPEYVAYANSLLPATVADIGGTGWSLTRLVERTAHPESPIVLVTRYPSGDLRQQYERIGSTKQDNVQSLLAGFVPAPIEAANLARHAMFIDHEKTFNPLNLDWDQIPEIRIMHEAFMSAVSCAQFYYFTSDLNTTDAILQRLLHSCLRRMSQYQNALGFAADSSAKEDRAVMERLTKLGKESK